MKKFLSVIILCFIMLLSLSINCFAQNESQDDIQSWMEPAEGDWYSTKGNLVMTIQDSSINGCKILGAQGCTYGYPRTGTFQVAEANGDRDMKMNLFGNNVHQYLLVDDKMVLRRSIHPEYNESVNGVYLGMTQDDFLLHHSKPANTVSEDGTERWNYDSDNFAVIFKGNIVVGIRMYKGCAYHFDKSGLGIADTPSAYVQAYGMNETPVIPESKDAVSPTYKIGYGEKLLFSPDYVQLSV